MVDEQAAMKWWNEHHAHVMRLIQAAGTAYEPTGSDARRPELWKGEHWKWFLANPPKKIEDNSDDSDDGIGLATLAVEVGAELLSSSSSDDDDDTTISDAPDSSDEPWSGGGGDFSGGGASGSWDDSSSND